MERCKGKSTIQEAFRAYALMGSAPRIAAMDPHQAAKEFDAKTWAQIAISFAGVIGVLVENAGRKGAGGLNMWNHGAPMVRAYIEGYQDADSGRDSGELLSSWYASDTHASLGDLSPAMWEEGEGISMQDMDFSPVHEFMKSFVLEDDDGTPWDSSKPASGKRLDRLGELWGLVRKPGEDDEAFRQRVVRIVP